MRLVTEKCSVPGLGNRPIQPPQFSPVQSFRSSLLTRPYSCPYAVIWAPIDRPTASKLTSLSTCSFRILRIEGRQTHEAVKNISTSGGLA